MVAILGANSVSGGYEVSNSLRFNDDDSPRLSKTFSGEGNKKTWSYSTWFKRGNLKSSGVNTLISAGATSGTNGTGITTENDRIRIIHDSGGIFLTFRSSQLLRDVSAWYHLLVTCDTTDATASERIKFYLNGNNITSDMSYNNGSAPSQNSDLLINDDVSMNIGARSHHNDLFFDGYMAETHLIDGTVKAPTDFGEFDDNAVWIPKKYSGTYGTNGFYLEFKETGTSQNSSGIGADTSGNDNHFAVNNLASTDITEDTCTNNFCTFNPIDTPQTNPTLSEGNVKLATQASPAYTFDVASFGLQQGKWYWEIKCSGAYDDDYHMVGIASTQPTAHNQELGYFTNDYGLYGGGGSNSLRYGATFYSYGNAINNNDIVGVALDLDNNRLYFSINGTFQNSSNPANGTNPISITDPSSTGRGFYFPAVCFLDGSNSATYEGNWGNPSFSISSGNNDGKYGNFEYAPPSGYYALCTKRLAEFG